MLSLTTNAAETALFGNFYLRGKQKNRGGKKRRNGGVKKEGKDKGKEEGRKERGKKRNRKEKRKGKGEKTVEGKGRAKTKASLCSF